MPKKKLKQTLALIPLLALLTGCLNTLEEELGDEEIGPNEVYVETTRHQISNDFYRAVIVDGKYQLGVGANVDNSLSSRGNTYAFEEGLLRISRSIFPTDQYYLTEGQVIDAATMTEWLSRESEDNPNGLNPQRVTGEETVQEEEESVDPADAPENSESQAAEESNELAGQVQRVESSAPIYLEQIMEKNIMVETEEGFQISGILIGLAMNSEYEYTDEHGTVFKQEISLGEMRERGKSYANIIAGRLRNTPELRSVPIVFGIYQVTPTDDVVGGTYLMDGISREGNYVTDWTERSEYRVALPVIDESGDAELERYGYFDEFSKQVKNFFPNLNGISGQALYVEGGLAELQVNIVTQFYQQTEIAALTQHVNDVAQRVLPEGINIEIRISSAAGTQAYVGRSSDNNQFQSHVFQ